MDIKAQIEKAAKKILADEALMSRFKTEPVKAVEKALGIDLPDDVMEKIIDGVKAAIAAEGAKDVLGKLKKLF